MKLWLLQALQLVDEYDSVWGNDSDKWCWDCCRSGYIEELVIRAKTEHDARAIASETYTDGSDALKAAWLNPALTGCEEVTVEGEIGVVSCG